MGSKIRCQRMERTIPNNLWLEPARPPVLDVGPYVASDYSVASSAYWIDQADLVKKRKPVEDEGDGGGLVLVGEGESRAQGGVLGHPGGQTVYAHQQLRESSKVEGAETPCRVSRCSCDVPSASSSSFARI